MIEKIIKGSGNVFEDLGFKDSSELTAKAELALEILEAIQKRKLTQKEAATLIGAKQPDISKLKSGNLEGFTFDRLISFLRRLDRSVEIRITKPRSKHKQGMLETIAA